MKLYSGIDLHSNNNLIAIKDINGKKVFSKRVSNNMKSVLTTLEPYKEKLENVVVESTYNWYWLVDGLMKENYNVKLANPGAITQYSGLKHTNDESDAFHLAELSRLNILPTGYICPVETRDIRDVLRKRLLFVQERTKHYLSLKSTITRNTGKQLNKTAIVKLKSIDIKRILKDKPGAAFIVTKQFNEYVRLTQIISDIEKWVLERIKLKDEFEILKTVPGIGVILGLTIMLETGDIARFKKVGNYTSYCRCSSAAGYSNDKKKHENNRKNGNKYLSWAFVEAAHGMITYCLPARKFYDRKKSKVNGALATKALAAKITKAVYYMLTRKEMFDITKIFN
jgi:transposase